MITGGTIGAIMSGLIALVIAWIRWKKSPEAKRKRETKEHYRRDKEIADKDHDAKSKRLSNLLDSLRRHNRRNSKR